MRHQCEEEAESQARMIHPGSAGHSLKGATHRLSGEAIVNRAIGVFQHREESCGGRAIEAATQCLGESPSIASRGDHRQGSDEMDLVLWQQVKGGMDAANDLCWWMEEPVLFPPLGW